MVILGIDTSSTDLSICLSIGDSPVATVNRYVRNSHAEHIAQAVKLALDLGGVDVKDVTHIAISTGPGSFTGLRIGLSFIKGMCLMTERKVLPLSSLMVLAHAVGHGKGGRPMVTPTERVFVALDARQGRIHWGSFVCVGGWGGSGIKDDKDCSDNKDRVCVVNKEYAVRRLTDDRLSSPEELLNEIGPSDILVTDTMGYSRSTVFNMFEGKAEIISAEKSALARGLSCASIAFSTPDDNNQWQPANAIVPNYLQMSAAEEKKAPCS